MYQCGRAHRAAASFIHLLQCPPQQQHTKKITYAQLMVR